MLPISLILKEIFIAVKSKFLGQHCCVFKRRLLKTTRVLLATSKFSWGLKKRIRFIYVFSFMLIYFQFYFYIFRNQHLPVKELFS